MTVASKRWPSLNADRNRVFPLRLRIYADCPASSGDPEMRPSWGLVFHRPAVTKAQTPACAGATDCICQKGSDCYRLLRSRRLTRIRWQSVVIGELAGTDFVWFCGPQLRLGGRSHLRTFPSRSLKSITYSPFRHGILEQKNQLIRGLQKRRIHPPSASEDDRLKGPISY